MSEQEFTKGGRPKKAGTRVRLNTHVSAPMVELLKTDAAAQGLSAGDRLSEILAAYYSSQDAAWQEAMPQAS